MDRYQKVEKPKPESPVNENEIRITSQGETSERIVLKAMGQAISKTVAIAEIIKRRVPRLHQDTAISSVSITDTFEPIEEGLQTYQAPFNVDQTKQQQYNYQPQQQQPPRQARAIYNTGNGDSYGRGRGRGRGGDEVGTEVDIQTTKKMVDIQVAIQVDILTGAEVAVVGVGYRGAGYGRGRGGGGEDMGEGVKKGGRPRGVAASKHSWELFLVWCCGKVLALASGVLVCPKFVY
ncbi:UNVERIFIED_CONTAM: hypothetical protein Sradi_0436100 [Sesamum radiatum]|uniref:DNA/RNA-binding protein Alba-like domain-containing protein n=1 Tax=Sesamum radiatum TaxID=300843 RepID=A0AAW2WAK8_SESRA